MTDSSRTQGRIIRAALVIFPFGTVILGMASFGIWWTKKNQIEERSYQHARALRRDLNESSWARHEGILKQAFAQPETERLATVATYLESSMGPENMGYDVRRDRRSADVKDCSNIAVELIGKQRPREVVLLLAPYGKPGAEMEEARALAVWLSLAHALTGESGTRTLRFAALPSFQDSTALERLQEFSARRDERLIQVVVLGASETLQEVRRVFRTEESGTILRAANVPNDIAGAAALQAMLTQARE